MPRHGLLQVNEASLVRAVCAKPSVVIGVRSDGVEEAREVTRGP